MHHGMREVARCPLVPHGNHTTVFPPFLSSSFKHLHFMPAICVTHYPFLLWFFHQLPSPPVSLLSSLGTSISYSQSTLTCPSFHLGWGFSIHRSDLETLGLSIPWHTPFQIVSSAHKPRLRAPVQPLLASHANTSSLKPNNHQIKITASS